jgi:hypothetical protein
MQRRGSGVARKATIVQRDFSRGEISEAFLEARDTELRAASLRRARNVRLTSARTPVERPGSVFFQKTTSVNGAEIRLLTGEKYLVLFSAGGYSVVSRNGVTEHEGTAPWADGESVWAELTNNQLILGCPEGLFTLSREDGSWELVPFAFESASNGEIFQPYWAFDKNAGVQPSGRTGTISLTASRPIFRPGHVGVRARYNGSEVSITAYVSPTQVSASVISELPPSFLITVENAARFNPGEVVEGQDTGFRGIVSSVTGNQLRVSTLTFFDGPDLDENLGGPGSVSKITAKSEIAPLASDVWDEQLISSLRGFPRSGTSASGRLIFVNFPEIPDLLAISSARSLRDFKVGAADDDAIVRQIGDNSPRIHHVVNSGDILIFTDRGCYYTNVRDNGLLTPANFAPVLFDARGASTIRPVAVDDGVIFVEASGKSIAAALLDGNVYLKWSVRTISNFYEHLIRAPKRLAGPELFSEAIEKYVFVINDDGTVAVMSWFTDFTSDSVGFVLWETQGEYVSIFGAFGSYIGIFRRDLGDGPELMVEQISPEFPLDCCGGEAPSEIFHVGGEPFLVGGETFMLVFPSAHHLDAVPAQTYDQGLSIGVRQPGEEVPAGMIVGLPFTLTVEFWPVEVIQSERAGIFQARTVRGAVSVLNAEAFEVHANNTVNRYGAHSFGDVPEDPPPKFTGVKRFLVVGERNRPSVKVVKSEPGGIQILSVTQEVTY